MRRLAFACAVLAVGSVGIDASAAPSGSLDLQAELMVVSSLGPCPAGLPQSAVCAARTSNGRVRGLGSASASYTWALDTGHPTCAAGEARVLGYPVTIDVAGKGALRISVAELGRCVAQEPSRNEPQSFTIVGGTGLYAGASGQGTVERLLGQTSGGATGRETWTATINVPGLEFDIVAPVITVTAPKPVRLSKTGKRARVHYRVAGLDAVDGVVPVVCRPRSGAWFPLGRSLVRCSATDASGNEAVRSFGVVVRRGR
jgi:HYR domain-containing protein